MVNYPNNSKKQFTKLISHKNRGMELESIIDETNKYYLENDIALIYKKPTPINVVKVKYENNKKIIENAYFKSPSTLDYNGIYKGHYIEFDAKETQNKTSFPLSNIHEHQITHLKRVLSHNGIAFLIIQMNGNIFLLDSKVLTNFLESEIRKSIPYEFLEKNAYVLKYNYIKGINYLDYVDLLIKGEDKIGKIKY